MKTVNEIGQEYGVHPGQAGLCKTEIQERTKTLFEGKRGCKPMGAHREPELLCSEIGKTVEVRGLRKDGSELPLEIARAQWETAAGDLFDANRSLLLATLGTAAMQLGRQMEDFGYAGAPTTLRELTEPGASP